MSRRRIIVSGTVQGVFFRASCRQEAVRLGVAGWVANRADGTVEAVVEGSAEAVESMVDWCRVGPPRASVSGVEVSAEKPEGLSGFEER